MPRVAVEDNNRMLWIAKIKDEQLGLRAEYSQKIGNWPEGVASHCFRPRATRIGQRNAQCTRGYWSPSTTSIGESSSFASS